VQPVSAMMGREGPRGVGGATEGSIDLELRDKLGAAGLGVPRSHSRG
jgi:hypothetical protein